MPQVIDTCVIREGFPGEVTFEPSLRAHRLLQWGAAWGGGFPSRGQ